MAQDRSLKLASDIHEKKFNMFQNGPAVMELKRLHERVDEIKRMALEDNNTFSTRYLPQERNNKDSNTNPNTNIDDLGKP